MLPRTLGAACVGALVAVVLTTTPAAAAFVDRDCTDFTYQEDAQALYDQYAPSDPHRLDADGDGIACETLPHRPAPAPKPAPAPAPAPAPVPAPAPAPAPAPVAVGYSRDWTGDRNADVLATSGDGALLLYPGNGRGGFLPRSQIGKGWASLDQVTQAGDWDGDGRGDITARTSTGHLMLYPGNGRGGFLSARTIGKGWHVFSSIVAPGDWTGDKRPDLLTVRADDGSMWLYPGNGRAGFLAPSRIGHGWQSISGITAVGDFDVDGANDLVARTTTGQLRLYPGNGRGGFSTMRAYGYGWDAITAMTGPGDFTRDKRPDLLARTDTGHLRLYPGDGRGGFAKAAVIGNGWGALRILGSSITAPSTPPVPPAPPAPPAPEAPPADPGDGTAAALLEGLTVTAETTAAYDRDALFGGWGDADGDGCDTRAEVLERDTQVTVTYTTATGRTVATGHWTSYVDGATWTMASDVDIDHVVPLKEAWDSGAYADAWDAGRRFAYANDLGYPYSLEVVTDEVNAAKSDRDPAQWMPPLASSHCTYAVRWVAVKHRWQLSVDAAEHAALADVLTGECGDVAVAAPPRA